MEVKGEDLRRAITTERNGGSYRSMSAILKGFLSTHPRHSLSVILVLFAVVPRDGGLARRAKQSVFMLSMLVVRFVSLAFSAFTTSHAYSDELLQPLWRNGHA